MTRAILLAALGTDATARRANVPRPGPHSPKDRRLRIVLSRRRRWALSCSRGYSARRS
jgi:hypothetical protein